MRSSLPAAVTLASLAATLLGGCGEALQPPETFEWCRQPVRFAPPSPRWRREQYNQGGLLGVYFVLTASVGERMIVAEYHTINERDRRATLAELMKHLETDDEWEIRRKLAQARARTDDPVSADEARVAAEINSALDRATAAHLEGSPERVRDAVGEALRSARSYRLTLDDVLEGVRFRPERRQEPDRYRILREGATRVGDRPAFAVDYTLQAPERRFRCRDLYLVAGNCVFTASYQGLPSHLALFERVVGSMTFPEDSTDAGR